MRVPHVTRLGMDLEIAPQESGLDEREHWSAC
jgi:hypothetical protein